MKRRASKEQAEPAEGEQAGAEAAAEAPAAKRAKTEGKAKATAAKKKVAAAAADAAVAAAGAAAAAADAAVAVAAAAGAVEVAGEAAAAAKTARARKPRAKAAKAGGDAEGAAAAAAEAGGEAGEQETKPEAKRGKKAAAPVLPVYTLALRKPPPPAGAKALTVLSWNVAGLRALLKKSPDAVSSLAAREGAEVVCLQEHKLQREHTAELGKLLGLQGWSHHWACSTAKLGYSGVSVHTRTKPLSVTVGMGGPDGSGPLPDPEHEGEGRVVTVELPELFVVSVYVPNSSEGLKRLDYRTQRWDEAFAAYVMGLEARGKPVVLTGDLNCAHKEIDIHAPKTNLRTAGFTIEERESFERRLLGEAGLVDTFRSMFPDTVAYTYFTRRFNCREQNKGWRLDYFLTSPTLMPQGAAPVAAAGTATGREGGGSDAPAAAAAAAPASAVAKKFPAPPTPWRVYDTWIAQDVYGSDHLPLGLTLVRNEE